MEDSKRQQIVTSVISQLGQITKANGYNLDIGKKVHEWEKFGDPDLDPDTIYVEDASCSPADPAEPDDNTPDMEYKSLHLEIIVQRSGKFTAAELRKALSDIYKAIGKWICPAGVYDIGWDGDGTEVDDRNKKFGGTIVKIHINYVTEKWCD